MDANRVCLLSLLLCISQVCGIHGFNPEEQEGLFEGDIELPPRDGFRSTLNDPARFWPHGIVTYEISPKAIFDDEQLANLTAAMDEFHKYTCVRWVKRVAEEKPYIRIINGNGCSSNVGMLTMSTISNFVQRIALAAGCFNKGILMHEMMHSIGFFHEQSRWDRDSYVRIVDSNIKQGVLNQFRIHKLSAQNTRLGAPYDYGSLMHYRKDTFSDNGEDTIVPINPTAVIGQREAFSDIDIWKINKVYKCPNYIMATLPPDAFTVPLNVPPTIGYPVEVKTRYGCTFDQQWACDFHDEMKSNLDWKIGKGAASRSGSTGPSADAYGKECCYMYMHTVGHNAGEIATLVGPILKGGQVSCLSFYYHMMGDSIGTLRVYIRDYMGDEKEVIFSKTGQQSLDWNIARFRVEYDRPFRLVFEATVGDSEYSAYDGDIAIDSVRFAALEDIPSPLREECV